MRVEDNSAEKACAILTKLLDQITLNDSPPSNIVQNHHGDGIQVRSSSPLSHPQQPRSFKVNHNLNYNQRQSHSNKAPTPTTQGSSQRHVPIVREVWSPSTNTSCTSSQTSQSQCSSHGPTTNSTTKTRSRTTTEDEEEEVYACAKSILSLGNRSLANYLKQTLEKLSSSPLPRDPFNHRITLSLDDEKEHHRNRPKMFGSEYARFLSSSVFTPSPATNNHNRRRAVVSGNIGGGDRDRGSHGGPGPPPIRPRAVPSVRGSSRERERDHCLLEEADHNVLTGPVTDLCVTYPGEVAPAGYYRITQSADGNLLPGPWRLHLRKEPDWARAAQRPSVTALAVVYPDRREFVPPGYCVVRRAKGGGAGGVSSQPAAANLGPRGGERVYLCFKKSREGNPVTGVLPLLPQRGEAVPTGYTVLERTPRNHVADLGGGEIFFAYRQRLTNLETLRPLPLLRSHKKAGAVLTGYFCTGGTVVPSRVGDIHIMDRSTHTMLSPCSVTNRLALIHNSSVNPSPPHNQHPDAAPLSPIGSPAGRGRSKSRRQHRRVRSVSDPGSVSSILVNDSLDIIGVGTCNSNGNAKDNLAEVTKSGMDDSGAEDDQPGDDDDDYDHGDDDLEAMAFAFIPMVTDGTGRALADPTKIELLTPILTACYTHHGGSALLAVEGLHALLHSGFFPAPSTDCDDHGHCLTLLDLAIQVVCDLAMSSSRETHFKTCVDFITDAVRMADGRLSYRTLGYVMRFYSFVFYFGAYTPTTSVWPHHQEDKDIPMLMEVPDNNASMGAPQASALGLKQLLTIILQPRQNASSSFSPSSPQRRDSSSSVEALVGSIMNNMGALQKESSTRTTLPQQSSVKSFVGDIIDDVVNDSIRRLDVHTMTDLAIRQIHRSGGSELFWHDMIEICGKELFRNDQKHNYDDQEDEENDNFGTVRLNNTLVFAILATCVKMASGTMRRVNQGDGIFPRDLATKRLSLELLHHFLVCLVDNGEGHTLTASRPASRRGITGVRQRQRSIHPSLLYAVRRLVVPCILGNTLAGLEDASVFRSVLAISHQLWSGYRTHLKTEIAVWLEHSAVRILRIPPAVYVSLTATSDHRPSPRIRLYHPLEVLDGVMAWLESPHDLLELFWNYDLESHDHTQHWRACQSLCGALCRLAEQCGDIITEQIHTSRQMRFGEDRAALATTVRDAARSLQEKSMDAICHVLRLLMEVSWQLYRTKTGTKVTEDIRRVFSSGSWDSYQPPTGPGQIVNGPYYDPYAGLNYPSFYDEDDDDNNDSDESSICTVDTAPQQVPEQSRHSSFSPKRQQKTPPTSSFCSTFDSATFYPFSTSQSTPPRLPSCCTSLDIDTNPNDNNTQNQKKRSESPKPIRLQPIRPPMHKAESSPNVFRGIQQRHQPQKVELNHRVLSKASELEAEQRKTMELLEIAFEIIYNDGLKKGLDYLIACNILLPGPREVASFLRIHQKRLDPAVLGEYLGEGGHAGDGEYWNFVRYHYIRAISFVGMQALDGLRTFLTRCGFRLPGEAQKIDRIITTFAQCFWEDNAGDQVCCPFRHQDTINVLSFAIIMLNTDLHRSTESTRGSVVSNTILSKRKERKKMTRQEFINNLRGSDDTKYLSKEYLSKIYDSVAAYPIILNYGTFMKREKKVSMHETANKANMLAASSDHNNHNKSSNFNNTFDNENSGDHNTNTTKAYLRNVKPSLELLRQLGIGESKFVTTRDDNSDALTVDFVSLLFKSIWHHFYGVVNATLDAVQLDPQCIGSCLNILRYSICTTILLDMKVERKAFVTQLATIKFLKERGMEDGARIGLSSQQDHPQVIYNGDVVEGETPCQHELWFQLLDLDEVSATHHPCVMRAIDQVNTLTRELRRSMKIDSRVNRAMHKVTRRIRNGDLLLSDPTRSFLREGDLMKRSNRSGRYVLYRFFLFSDVLIYAHKSSACGDYKIHEELPLYLMKIRNVTSKRAHKHKQNCHCFQIHHPKKSFLVCAPIAESKSRWMKDIKTAIANSLERKAGVHEQKRANSNGRTTHS